MWNRGTRGLALIAFALGSIGSLHASKPRNDHVAVTGSSSANSAASTNPLVLAPVVLAPAFFLSQPAPSIVRLLPGQASMVNIALTANATFRGKVALSCSGGTRELQCLISPASITLAEGQTISATVAVATQRTGTPLAQLQSPNRRSAPPWFAGLSVFFACALARRRPRRVAASLMLAGIFATIALLGCNQTGISTSARPSGDTTLTITASSGSAIQTRVLTIHVTE